MLTIINQRITRKMRHHIVFDYTFHDVAQNACEGNWPHRPSYTLEQLRHASNYLVIFTSCMKN